MVICLAEEVLRDDVGVPDLERGNCRVTFEAPPEPFI